MFSLTIACFRKPSANIGAAPLSEAYAGLFETAGVIIWPRQFQRPVFLLTQRTGRSQTRQRSKV